jgi:hypothetical protein
MYLLQADTIKETAQMLTAFSGLDLIIVAVLIIAVVLICRFLPKWIDKKSEVKMLEINKNNEQMEIETNALVKETSNRLEKLEGAISKLDYKNVFKNVLMSIIYNENIPVLERLEAFNEYLKLGGNGNCKKFVMMLILNNKELWQSIISKDEQHIEDLNDYYLKSLSEIKINVLI